MSSIYGSVYIKGAASLPDIRASSIHPLPRRKTQAFLYPQNDEFAAIQTLMRAALGETQPGMRRTEEHLRRVRETDAGRALLHSALLIGSYERR